MGTFQYWSHVVLEEIGELRCSNLSLTGLFPKSPSVYMKYCELPETSEERGHTQAPSEVFLGKDGRKTTGGQTLLLWNERTKAFGEELGNSRSSCNITELYIANRQLQLLLTELHATCLHCSAFCLGFKILNFTLKLHNLQHHCELQ